MADTRIARFRSLFGIPLLMVFAGLSSTARGTPSHKVLDAPLPVHGKGPVVAWHQEASQRYSTARSKLLSFLERAEKGSGQGIAAADLGRTSVLITQFRRLGGWMEIYGEPAGADFRLRAGVMHGHLGRVINASMSLPATQKYANRVRVVLAETAQKRLARAAEIEKLCVQQKWEAAERELHDVYDGLEPGIIFISPEERLPIYRPFLEAATAIDRAMNAKRATAAQAELAAAIQSLNPGYQAKLEEISHAVDGVATTGVASWRGEMVPGPLLVEKIGQAWRETQVQSQQLRAKSWALAHRTYAHGNFEAPGMQFDSNPVDPIASDYAQFSQLVRAQLARLVEGDGLRATVDVTSSLYGEYLVALAPLSRQVNDAAWSQQLATALEKFQGKVPDLDRQVKGYHLATNDLLRWKARVAIAQARGKQQEFTTLPRRFQEAVTSGKVGESEYLGLIPAPPSPMQQPQLLTAAPDIMPEAVRRLIEKPVSVSDVVRIAPESKASIARYTERTYANVPTPLPIQAEVEALKLALLVSPQAPPLSLIATQAVLTADRQDLVAVGGTISGVYLEGVITRFATLPASAAVLMELGELPPEKLEGSALVNMLMRFEIAPQWAQHDYFFINLAPSPTQTTQLTSHVSPRIIGPNASILDAK